MSSGSAWENCLHIILRVLGVVNSIREPGKGGKKLEHERRKLPGQRHTHGMGWGGSQFERQDVGLG